MPDIPAAEKEFPTMKISLDQIDIPQDARAHDPGKLESLVQDMKDQGQIQPIVVSPQADRFVVVVGVGRVLGARKLNWTQIKAEVREGLSDFDKARLTYSENEEREDADPFYQAAQLQKMMKTKGWGQNELARNIGSGKADVSRYLSLVGLEPEVEGVFRRRNTSMGQITEILRLKSSSERVNLADECAEKDYSVKALRALVDQKLGDSGKAPKPHKGNGKDATPQEFRFSQKPGGVAINAFWDQSKGDADAFLPRLRGALLLWVSQKLAHSSQPSANSNGGQKIQAENCELKAESSNASSATEVNFTGMTSSQVDETVQKMQAAVNARNKAKYEAAKMKIALDNDPDVMVASFEKHLAKLQDVAVPEPAPSPAPAAPVKKPLDPRVAALIARRKA